jgi:hypothetical protein
MRASRIPDFNEHTAAGMQWWFAEMSARDLIFHCEDSPREIVNIDDGRPAFTDEEYAKLEGILTKMYEMFGDGVVEAEYPIFMKKAGALHVLNS